MLMKRFQAALQKDVVKVKAIRGGSALMVLKKGGG